MSRLTTTEYAYLFGRYDLNRFMTEDHELRDSGPFRALAEVLGNSAPEYFADPLELDERLLDQYAGRRITKALAGCYVVNWSVRPPDVAADWNPESLKDLMLRIYRTYERKWDLLYHDLTEVEYNPIENYNSTETETSSGESSGTKSGTSTGSGSESASGSDNRKLNLAHGHAAESVKETEALGKTLAGQTLAAEPVTEEGDIAGFNSPADSYADANKVTRKGTTATQRDTSYIGSDTDTGTESTAHTNEVERSDSRAYSDTESGTHSGTVTRSRHGNIGVTTNQQMLTAEIELRSLYQFYNIIVEDVANELTLHIF